METNEFYPYSLAEACERDENAFWKENHRENIRCKEAIEEAIRESFDGMWLKPDCAHRVIEQFGLRRTAFVLANSIQQKEYDGRFSIENKGWANSLCIPSDKINNRDFNADFVVESHPAVLDGFVNQCRGDYRDFGMSVQKQGDGDGGEHDFREQSQEPQLGGQSM